MLVHEVDHRVKNNIQMISALLSMQGASIRDPESRASLASMLQRVESIGAVHRRLYQSKDVRRFDLAEFVRDISGELLKVSGREDIELELDLQSVQVPAPQASPLSLMLNELMMNAFKHAFPAGRGGRLVIAVHGTARDLKVVDRRRRGRNARGQPAKRLRQQAHQDARAPTAGGKWTGRRGIQARWWSCGFRSGRWISSLAMTDEPLRVLIVEDEALLLMQLEASVEAEGHDVVGTAMSAGEAIALARMVEPDIAFVDLQLLDGPTGLFVARHLRGAAKTVFVFITANATRIPDDYEGAAGIVSKPFSQAGITATIRYLNECVRRPVPGLAVPAELKVAPQFQIAVAEGRALGRLN